MDIISSGNVQQATISTPIRRYVETGCAMAAVLVVLLLAASILAFAGMILGL